MSDQSATSGDGAGRGNGGLLLWGPAGGRRGVPRGSGAQFTTTSCVRHCAEGEWGAKRAGGSRETVEVGVSKRIGWVFSTGPMPYRSTATGGPRPGLMPRPESRQMLPTLLSSILLWHLVLLSLSGGQAGGLCVISPRGTLPSPSLPPTPEKQEPTGHFPPLAVPRQRCWIPTELRASLGRHLLPRPWRPGDAWTSLAGG